MDKSNAYKLAIVLILTLMIQACSPETPIPYSTPKPKNISDEVKDEYFALITHVTHLKVEPGTELVICVIQGTPVAKQRNTTELSVGSDFSSSEPSIIQF